MGIRKSIGKNKKSNWPTDAASVEREGILRNAGKTRGRPGTRTVKSRGAGRGARVA